MKRGHCVDDTSVSEYVGVLQTSGVGSTVEVFLLEERGEPCAYLLHFCSELVESPVWGNRWKAWKA